MNKKLAVALLLLVVAIVPVSIAIDLLVWPGNDIEYERVCGIIWIGVIPAGGYCARAIPTAQAIRVSPFLS